MLALLPLALAAAAAVSTAVPVAAPAVPPDAGVDAYRARDYAAARELWLSELDAAEGPERGRLLYNLGNAAFREEHVHEAVGWYTAALRYQPRDRDTWANLEFARSEAGLEPADRGDLAATVERLLSALTLAESEWLVLAALAAWSLVLAGEALRGGRGWARAAWAGAALVGLSLGPWVYNQVAASGSPALVVAERGVGLLSEPRAGAARIAKADSGAVVQQLDELPAWVRVRGPEGAVGWVPRETVFDLAR